MNKFDNEIMNKNYSVVNYFLNTLARLKIWNFDIESYTGWRPAIRRLAAIGVKHEELHKASEIQRQIEAQNRMYGMPFYVASSESSKKSSETN